MYEGICDRKSWAKFLLLYVLLKPMPSPGEQVVFMMPNWNVLILCRIGNNLNKSSDLGFSIERHAEEL